MTSSHSTVSQSPWAAHLGTVILLAAAAAIPRMYYAGGNDPIFYLHSNVFIGVSLVLVAVALVRSFPQLAQGIRQHRRGLTLVAAAEVLVGVLVALWSIAAQVLLGFGKC